MPPTRSRDARAGGARKRAARSASAALNPQASAAAARGARRSLVIELPARGKLGVRLRCARPLELTAAEIARVRELAWTHRLLVFEGIALSNAEYVRFASQFGTPQPYHLANYHHPDHPEIFVSSNVPLAGQKVGVAGTGRFWHTDYSFMPRPLSFTLVYPQIIPEGVRGTKFVDLHEVWRELPGDLRSLLEGRQCFHDAADYYKIQPKDVDRAVIDLVREFRAHAPGTWHPALITHPVTGERGVYVSEGFTRQISGLAHEHGNEVLARVHALCQREERVHFEQWHAGDLFLWDNRLLNHHAGYGSPGQQSCSFRISVYDGQPFYVGHTAELEAQAAATAATTGARAALKPQARRTGARRA
jgi:taurine dioxygenase